MADRSGKSDMERIGLFMEMSYVSIGDRYVSRGKFAFNDSASTGKQMLPGGSKENSALQHGYFDIKYNRIFEGECFSDPIAIRRRFRMNEKKKDVGKPFLPANGLKMVCGLGSYYGTIGGSVPAFSPHYKTRPPAPKQGKNVQTNPSKRGTGYGYANVTLSPYPSHSVDPYTKAKEQMQSEIQKHKGLCKGGPFRLNLHPEELFDINPYKIDKPLPPVRKPKVVPVEKPKPFKPSSPGKVLGGGKFGTFDPYPNHSSDVYTEKKSRVINVVNSSGKHFTPHPGPKTRPVNSIVAQNVLRSMNVMNYRTMESVMA